MTHLYVRTRNAGAEFYDDRHHFTHEWAKVPEGELGSVHLENPHLEVETEKEHAKKQPKDDDKT